MEQKLGTYSYQGINISYRKGTEDEKVLNHSFEKDIFFKEIPAFKPTEHPVIIDIGAHIGTFSLLSFIKYPGATIYAYEPSYESFQILNQNKNVNGISCLNIFQEAVAASNGRAKLFHNQKTGNWGHSITESLSESFEMVNTTTLEKVICANKIEFVDLIKFNCEGAEFEILFSTPHALIKKIGVGIILYHEDLGTNKWNANRLVRLFKGLNYRVVTIRKGTDRGWIIVWNKKKYSWPYFIAKAAIRRLKG